MLFNVLAEEMPRLAISVQMADIRRVPVCRYEGIAVLSGCDRIFRTALDGQAQFLHGPPDKEARSAYGSISEKQRGKSMDLQVGEILEGKVSGITKFGAFVVLPDGRSGLVHISEVANAFVSDVSEHVQLGQTVKVRLLSITPDGKINLSIKRAAEDSPQNRPKPAPRPTTGPAPVNRSAPVIPADASVSQNSGNMDFEDRLKKFMQESDSKIADSRIYADHRQRRRGR